MGGQIYPPDTLSDITSILSTTTGEIHLPPPRTGHERMRAFPDLLQVVMHLSTTMCLHLDRDREGQPRTRMLEVSACTA